MNNDGVLLLVVIMADVVMAVFTINRFRKFQRAHPTRPFHISVGDLVAANIGVGFTLMLFSFLFQSPEKNIALPALGLFLPHQLCFMLLAAQQGMYEHPENRSPFSILAGAVIGLLCPAITVLMVVVIIIACTVVISMTVGMLPFSLLILLYRSTIG